MPGIIVHLSDLHITSQNSLADLKTNMISKAICAEIDGAISICIVVVSGDLAYSGQSEEYAIAEDFINHIKKSLNETYPCLEVNFLVVPGNHDCDLISKDTDARGAVRSTVTNARPSESIENILLKAQEHYFDFSSSEALLSVSLSKESAYYAFKDFDLDGKTVRFHLLNSAFTSMIKESDDLRFPLDEFAPPKDGTAEYSVAVLHHPAHWFHVPSVRKALQDKLEMASELILTGHEHDPETTRSEVLEGPELDYLEGGVLHDTDDPSNSAFNIVTLDVQKGEVEYKQLCFTGDAYETTKRGEKDLIANPYRRDRQRALKNDFKNWLDELEDPFSHPRVSDLRLSHIFTYPDLRKPVVEAKRSDSEVSKDEIIERIKSVQVLEEFKSQSKFVVIGGDRSGKTSLAKQFFGDQYASGLHPLLVQGSDIPRSGNESVLRKRLQAVVKKQYKILSPETYEQIEQSDKTVIVDNIQDGPVDARARAKVIDYLERKFGQVVLIGSDEYYLEILDQNKESVGGLLTYQRYEICDFGHIRLEELAERWISLGNSDPEPVTIRDEAKSICERVEVMLSVASLPHTPWLLLVMLEQVESSDAPAAKSGSFGHLYQAIITVALTRSHMMQLDISGKYTYLAELAYYLYKKEAAILDSSRDFHEKHCTKYDLSLDHDKLICDLLETRLLRLDGENLAFRHKYVYCFFVAWWLSRNMHEEEAQTVVSQLCSQSYHDVSANILVFLAHLTDAPIVLQEMKRAANQLFSDGPATEFSDDLQPLNKLSGIESLFRLPETPPEINRRLLTDAQDEEAAKNREPGRHDGRLIETKPADEDKEDSDNLHRRVKEIRATHRTMRILGQVLCNGVSSIKAEEKQEIMRTILMLGRRMLGNIYAYLDDFDKMVEELANRFLRLFEADSGEDGETSDEVKKPTKEEAKVVAEQFWFHLYWIATYATLKRLSAAVGLKALDSTIDKVIAKDDVIPNVLVKTAMRLNRRSKHINAAEIVKLHQQFKKTDNKIARVVLEAIVFERLLLFETGIGDKQKVCKQMGIHVPVKSYDPKAKKFGH